MFVDYTSGHDVGIRYAQEGQRIAMQNEQFKAFKKQAGNDDTPGFFTVVLVVLFVMFLLRRGGRPSPQPGK